MIKHKDVKKLVERSRERRKEGLYIVEGPKMVYEAVELGLAEKVFVSERFAAEEGTDRLSQIVFEVLSDSCIKDLSDTVTPQGIIAAVKINDTAIDDMMATVRANDRARFIILENVQDPGNLGTIIRTAEAAGYDGVLMNRGTVDIYNPKVVRSTMGAIFRVPHCSHDTTNELLDACRTNNIRIYGAALSGKDIREMKYADRCAVVIGNESNGISEETLSACDELIKIPMAGSVESLNASVAAGLLMYHSNLENI